MKFPASNANDWFLILKVESFISKTSCGFKGSPKYLVSKCKWLPELRPVFPPSPKISPAANLSPSLAILLKH